MTHGDMAAAAIRKTGVTGPVVAWRDVLHEGPLPAGLPLEAMSEVRARFLATCRWGSFPELMRQFGARDAALRGARRVTLWFDHSLLDQLQLLQILATIAHQPETKAELINVDAFPGVAAFSSLDQLSPAQLAKLWPTRQLVSATQLTLGVRAWKAVSAPDPSSLRALLVIDTSALPFLRAALQRLLEEHPDMRSGLSRTDRQILAAIAAGHQTLAPLVAATQALETAPFHHDATLQLHLDALASGPTPLITREPFQLTEAGQRVLAGAADARSLLQLERWVGGVRLRS